MDNEPRGRVDPFAFPTDTTFRFVLLIAAVLGASLYLYNAVYLSIGNRAEDLATYRACLEAAGPLQVQDAEALGARSEFLHDCTASIERPKAAFMLGGVLSLLAGAALLYSLYPAWKLRRARLEPLTREDAAEVVDELDELAAKAGLRRSPEWVWNPLESAPSGLAFGRAGRYRVALTGGLVVLHTTDPATFRAVVLHELAHLRNRDVDRTYATMAVWWSFVALAIVPFAITLPGEPMNYVVALSWRVAALTALVYLVRNSVLRARERYADVRAAGWGAGEALTRLLGSSPAPRTNLLTRLRRVHPDPAERIATIADPAPLLSIGFGEAFAAGLAATVAYAEVASLIGFYSNEGLQVRWLAALVFAPLVAAVVGLGVWRAVYASQAAGTQLPSGLQLGLGLGLGLALGQTLAFSAAVPDEIAESSLRLIGLDPEWSLVLIASQVLFCAWLVAGATVWISRTPLAVSPWLAAVGVLVGGGALAVWLGLFFLAHDLAALWPIVADLQSETYAALDAATWVGPEAIWQAVMHPFAAVVLDEPFLLPLLVALWAFPLAAAFVGRTRPGAGRLAPGRTLLIGLAGAVVYTALLVLLRAVLDLTVSETTADGDAWTLALFYWMIGLALLVQAGAAAWAARAAPSLRVVHGLFAAFVTGSGAAWGLLGLNGLTGCVGFITVSSANGCGWVESSFVWQVYRQVVGEGALVALGAGLLVAAAVGLAERGRRTELQPAGAPQ